MEAFDAALLLLLDASAGDRGSLAARGLGRADARVDFERLFGWTGASLSAGIQGMVGAPLADHPAWQGLSNVDSEPFVAPADLFFEQQLGVFDLRLGRLDSAALMGVTETAALHLNPSMGFDPCNDGLPTYPAPASGIAARVEEGNGAVVVAAFGLDTPAALAGQAELGWEGGGASLGGWVEPGGADRGAWILADAALPSPGRVEPALWAVLATGAPLAGEAVAHVGGGIDLAGLLPRRGDDHLALGASWVALHPTGDELVVEALYALQANAAFAIVADVQHVQPTAATAVSLRLNLSL